VNTPELKTNTKNRSGGHKDYLERSRKSAHKVLKVLARGGTLRRKKGRWSGNNEVGGEGELMVAWAGAGGGNWGEGG